MTSKIIDKTSNPNIHGPYIIKHYLGLNNIPDSSRTTLKLAILLLRACNSVLSSGDRVARRSAQHSKHVAAVLHA